ncbi:hypothetical protein PVAP13_1KG160600 [Panicum virgatum]|uniref:Uncharacterized protein n=1 Tax=Panicum virgatum TaxID=38727 RepID=A0A8T0XKX5_PANVG|nr:hypothetical protein PVAP13_1KG160600 [Panicum virgatum]
MFMLPGPNFLTHPASLVPPPLPKPCGRLSRKKEKKIPRVQTARVARGKRTRTGRRRCSRTPAAQVRMSLILGLGFGRFGGRAAAAAPPGHARLVSLPPPLPNRSPPLPAPSSLDGQAAALRALRRATARPARSHCRPPRAWCRQGRLRPVQATALRAPRGAPAGRRPTRRARITSSRSPPCAPRGAHISSRPPAACHCRRSVWI